MTGPTDRGHVRRDDVTAIITSVIDEYDRTAPEQRRPDGLADAIVAALEEHGLQITSREGGPTE